MKKSQTNTLSESAVARQKRAAAQLWCLSSRFKLQHGRAPLYAIHTFGCQQNENDSEILAGYLAAMGYRPASGMEQADLILLNTCSVRENADNRFFGHLGMAKTLKQKKRDLTVVVCGCMMTQAQHSDKIRRSYPFVDIIMGTQDLYRFPELLWRNKQGEQHILAVSDENLIVEDQPITRSRRFRALISIMYGCNNFCAYCIVPYTRGRERSRNPERILCDIWKVAGEGYPEIMLLGQNVNAYGKDLPGSIDFAGLLEQAAQIPGIRRIRYMSSHPKDLSDRLIEVIGRYEKIEPHLHLALQSGSNEILRRMNRNYTREQYREICRKVREARPGITLTTDLLVGFPGETEADFQQTLDLMSEIRFDGAFTFIYSPRIGTPAATDPDQIPSDVVQDRFDRLLDLQNAHTLASNQAVIGEVQEVLIEGASGSSAAMLSGRTPEHRLVNFTFDRMLQQADLSPDNLLLQAESLEGRFARVHLTEAKTFSILGEGIELIE